MVLMQGPTGWRFLIPEVALYCDSRIEGYVWEVCGGATVPIVHSW